MTSDPQLDRTTYVPPEPPPAMAPPPPAANVNTAIAPPPAASLGPPIVPARDAVRWGPIWAGLVVALSSFLLLSLVAIVIGFQVVDTGDVTAQAAQTGAIITGVLVLFAFLIGGFVAGRTSAVPGRGAGLLNGFLVWALGLVLIVVLTLVGLGEIFGAVGDFFAQLRALGAAAEDIDREAVVRTLRNTSVIALASMALPALAAAIGGWAGARGGGAYVEI